MSEARRIALIAEGPTDFEVIQAALKAVLTPSFVLVQLQPENTQPRLGAGWCGVLKWCYAASQRHRGPLPQDPTLVGFGFDLFIIHMDVDVAQEGYGNGGEAVVTWAEENCWEDLPCNRPCPPISATVKSLAKVVESWLDPVELGDRALLCLPAQSSGTWLAAAVLSADHLLLANAECNPRVESGLGQLPRPQRIKKTLLEYRSHAPKITEKWAQVKRICSQAEAFEQAVLAVFDF